MVLFSVTISQSARENFPDGPPLYYTVPKQFSVTWVSRYFDGYVCLSVAHLLQQATGRRSRY